MTNKETSEETQIELTANQKAQAKAEELSVKHGSEVLPLVLRDEVKNEDVIGFFKMPNRATKARLLDKAMTSPVSGSGELFEALLLREESDPRFYSESSDNDRFYFGGATAVLASVKISVNQFKKNG